MLFGLNLTKLRPKGSKELLETGERVFWDINNTIQHANISVLARSR